MRILDKSEIPVFMRINRILALAVAAASFTFSCGNSSPTMDLKPGGAAWDFYEPHPTYFHSRAEATNVEWPPNCAEYPLVVKMNYTTFANHAVWGEDAVWNGDNPRVWISPRGWASDRATHYFECWLDHRYGQHKLSDMAFSCSGGLAIPRDTYESGRIRPNFERGATNMIWSFYNEDRTEHLASFEFEFVVTGYQDNQNNQCLILQFNKTMRQVEEETG